MGYRVCWLSGCVYIQAESSSALCYGFDAVTVWRWTRLDGRSVSRRRRCSSGDDGLRHECSRSDGRGVLGWMVCFDACWCLFSNRNLFERLVGFL